MVVANYAVTFAPDTTGVISARAITVTAGTDTKTYDGSTSSLVVPSITAGTLAGSDADEAFTQTFDTAAVGTGKTLTPAGSVLDGNGGANYTVTPTDSTGAITPAAVTVTADAGQSKTYGDADPTFAYHEVGLVAGDSFTGVLARDLGENVGTYAITQGTLANPNYTMTFHSANFTIDQRPITVTTGTDTKTYDGTTASLVVPTITDGTLAFSDAPAFTQTFDTKNVGTGKTLTPAGVVLDNNNGDNYLVAFVNDATGVISQRPITPVTAGTDTKTYDGSTSSGVVPSIAGRWPVPTLRASRSRSTPRMSGRARP